MSSDEEQQHETFSDTQQTQPSKKRRLQRSCDICRKKKIRCDSAKTFPKPCTNCAAFSSDCTHTEPVKKRGPKNKYVEDLQQRVFKMEEMLHKLQPNMDFTQAFDSPPSDRTSPDPPLSLSRSTLLANPIRHSGSSSTSTPGSSPAVNLTSEDDDLEHEDVIEHLKLLSVESLHDRFFGSSSGFMLAKNAMNIKKEFTGQNSFEAMPRRLEFWNLRPWEHPTPDAFPIYNFPDDDLIPHLIDVYFIRVDPFFPLLHRPSFERSVKAGLHFRNDQFGATLLLVCAVASRYYNDPRVFVDGSNSEASCGWKWFDQCQTIRKSLFDSPSLYEVQFYSLAALYLVGTSSPQSCWAYIGLGVRFTQERGVHRRKREGSRLTVEDEQWKRAFWVLLTLERLICSFLGRPSAMQEEDFDVDYPIDCDDEYWPGEVAELELQFKQPPGKPSRISFFIYHLKLCEIMAFALRTLYATNKSKVLLGLVGPDWEQRIVSDLDSAMNKVVDSIPDHLRWDPNRHRENRLFFYQSSLLYTVYYHLQIQIHRPFIHKPGPLALPSLAICTNAARSASHILDIQGKQGVLALPHMMMAAFISGIVLIMNVWDGKRVGLLLDPVKEMGDVQKCIDFLHVCERRWLMAGRLWDLLHALAVAGECPLPTVTSTKKRSRDSTIPSVFTENSFFPSKTKQSQFSTENAPVAPLAEEPRSADPASFPPAHGSGPNPLSDLTATGALDQITWNEFLAAQPSRNQVSVHPVDQEYNLDQLFGTNIRAQQFSDSGAFAMWSTAPTGFSLDDWGSYISSMGEANFSESASAVTQPSLGV